MRVEEKWQAVDDLSLDEILSVEQVTGVPWGAINPHLSAPVAKALLAAFLVRADGMTDDKAAQIVGGYSVGTIKNVYRYRQDDDLPTDWEDGLPVVDPKADMGAGSTG